MGYLKRVAPKRYRYAYEGPKIDGERFGREPGVRRGAREECRGQRLGLCATSARKLSPNFELKWRMRFSCAP